MTSKVAPCVTVMFCAAGCSATTSQTGPQAGTFAEPPPVRDKRAETPTPSQHVERAAIARQARPSPVPEQPVSVTVPMDVLMMDAAAPVAPVAEGPDRVIPARPVYEPADASVSPVAPETDTVAPVTLDPPRYVSVGPEYFGADSDIAPYVISQSAQATAPRRMVVAQAPREGWRPQVSMRSAPTPLSRSRLPRARPPLQSPEPSKLPTPLGDGEQFAALPPRPAPSPSQAPTEPAPRRPVRLPVEPTAMSVLRDGSSGALLPGAATQLPDGEGTVSDRLLSSGRGLNAPPPLGDEAPVRQLYRLQIDAAPAPEREAQALDFAPAPFPRGTTETPRYALPLTDALTLPAMPDDAPPPQMPRVRLEAILPAPVELSAPKAANDPGEPSHCAVHRGTAHSGADPRMILVCEGTEVSRADLLRAVIEGESAFRELRPFDAPGISTERFGLDADRFAAIADKPRSAADLAFLRDLRDVRQELHLKGRDFHVYRIKGHRGTATVLVQTQITLEDTPRLPTAVNQ